MEMVRSIRSTLGYIDGEFQTFAIDVGGKEFEALVRSGVRYDYIFNLSALKHVRSESDPYTLMRLTVVNVINTLKTVRLANAVGCQNYFCVSTDKAADPVNMMGASKRIMELFLMRRDLEQQVTLARFANVAFSDGSLLHGFSQRLAKRQPITAPKNIRRYFITPQESGELCLLAGLLGEARDIFFPKLREDLHQVMFTETAVRFLGLHGFEPFECASEEEARSRSNELIESGRWPCYFFDSDTTGEKLYEEFYTEKETLDLDRFQNIGIIKNEPTDEFQGLREFEEGVVALLERGSWNKHDLLELYSSLVPNFKHRETNKYLDARM